VGWKEIVMNHGHIINKEYKTVGQEPQHYIPIDIFEVISIK